jgi:hypothetical protein
VVSATTGPLYPLEGTGTNCIGGRVGLRAGLDVCGKSPSQPEFDPRTVQSVAIRYTDSLTPFILFPACPITPSKENNNNVVTAVFVTYSKFIDKDSTLKDTQLVGTVIHKSLKVPERHISVL